MSASGSGSPPHLFFIYLNDCNRYLGDGVRFSSFTDTITLWMRARKVSDVKKQDDESIGQSR